MVTILTESGRLVLRNHVFGEPRHGTNERKILTSASEVSHMLREKFGIAVPDDAHFPALDKPLGG